MTEHERQERTGSVDPSALTTQQLWREILNLRELLESRIDGIERLTESRISGIEKSIEVAHDDLVRVPTDVQKQVGNLKDLHEEKFRSIEIQFQERDTRVETSAKDNKDALAAALQAAKELVTQQNTSNSLSISKSEAATVKQIDQQGILIQTETRALSGQIDDLKDRQTRLESLGLGEKGGRTQQQQMISWILAVIMALIAIGTIIFTRPR